MPTPRAALLSLCLLLMLMGGVFAQSSPAPRLWRIVWADQSELWEWRSDSQEARLLFNAPEPIVHLSLSSLTSKIAFSTGQAGFADSLYLFDHSNNARLIYHSQDTWLSAPLWWQSRLVLTQFSREVPPRPLHDLWIFDEQGTQQALLAEGQGGALSLSPDEQSLLIIQAGRYGEQAGQVWRLRSLQEAPQALFDFPSISSGTHTPFYPPLAWSSDSQALYLSLPHPDALYSESLNDAPPVQVWYIPLAGTEPRLLTEVSASFFGLPVVNGAGTHVAYLRRQDANRFSVMLQALASDSPQTLAQGEIGTLSAPQWVGTSSQVWFRQGIQGLWSTVDSPEPRGLASAIFSLAWLDAQTFVYISPNGLAAELRLGKTDALWQVIARLSTADSPFASAYLP